MFSIFFFAYVYLTVSVMYILRTLQSLVRPLSETAGVGGLGLAPLGLSNQYIAEEGT